MNILKKRFVIIDGNAIIHRAYHAVPPLTNREGVQTNAVYGFASMLLKVLSDLKPDFLVVTFDMAGGTFRNDISDAYKATRVKADQELYDQIPLVHEMVEGFGVPIFEKVGYEADDVIGTIAKNVVKNDGKTGSEIEVVIVSGDKDLLQLVNDHVHVYLLKKGLTELEMYTPEKVVERFGFVPVRMIDYKAIAGDSSDNIPGVKGVGEVGAKDLLAKVGGLDDIYKRIDELADLGIKKGVIEKLRADEKGARMSFELATIHNQVPDLDFDLERTKFLGVDHERLVSLFQKFGFVSLMKRLPGANPPKADQPWAGKKEAQKIRREKKGVVEVDAKNFEDFLSDVIAAKIFAAREILTSSDIFQKSPAGYMFATEKEIYFVQTVILEKKQVESFFKIFEDKKKILVGHDVKMLVKVLLLQGIEVKNILFDLMIASYLLDSSTRAHDLQSVVLRELGEEIVQIPKETLFGVDPAAYAAEVEYFLPLYDLYVAGLEKENTTELFESMEMALIPVLSHMEVSGVAVDLELLKKLSSEVNAAIDAVTKKIWKEAGEEFNVASSTQLRDILFEKMGLVSDGIKKGKTGYSTAASELEKLRGMSPIIEMIEEHRELAKLQNTYIDVLPTLVNVKTGRIHSTFNQAVASTGRLSSMDPNLQNIPIRTALGREVRRAFWAEEGNILVAADYSQIELRIVAALAEDQIMIDVFKNGEDIHRATAAVINGVPLEEVTKEMRSAAKAINFGVLYGQGAYGLAAQTGMTQFEAKEFIAKYFEKFEGVKKYMDAVLEKAKETGYVETFFGRRRYIPELRSSNFQLRNSGERMAINMPVQGTAADIMKLGMIEMYKRLQECEEWARGEIKMILQVHDEIVVEVREGLEEKVSAVMKKAMEEVIELPVPIVVEVSVGKRWGDLK